MSGVDFFTKNLAIGYHRRSRKCPVVSDLNLALNPGKLTCLIGSNGIGKSTLLRTLAGLQKPVAGEILLEDQNLQSYSPIERARKISVVFTGDVHAGDLRGSQVVQLGRLPYADWSGRLTDQDYLIVWESLHQMSALPLADRLFGTLSDGERQKVLIARAIAQQTPIMILDEPSAFLDWANRLDLLETLKQIAADHAKAILISSHDLEMALRIADEVWLLDDQKQIAIGSGDELLRNGSLSRAFAGKYTGE